MVHDMRKGEPAAGDQGLDQTHTWGRTYWGGALFCLVADVKIRRETQNRKGLQDALRAIVAQGGTIDHDWPLDQALAIGDRATGTHVLTRMYCGMERQSQCRWICPSCGRIWGFIGQPAAQSSSSLPRPWPRSARRLRAGTAIL